MPFSGSRSKLYLAVCFPEGLHLMFHGVLVRHAIGLQMGRLYLELIWCSMQSVRANEPVERAQFRQVEITFAFMVSRPWTGVLDTSNLGEHDVITSNAKTT